MNNLTDKHHHASPDPASPYTIRNRKMTYAPRVITGHDYQAIQRDTVYKEAREVRQHLRPIRPQAEVAVMLGLAGKSSVEIIELRALSKVIRAFHHERITSSSR
jgi:hypothetical protein